MSELNLQIEHALDSMRPFLRADGGDVELVDVSPEMVVTLRLLGSCSNCEMSHMTMKAGIEEGLKKAVPAISSVVAIKN